MSFTTEIVNKQFTMNFVVQFGLTSPTYFSTFQPDSGLTVDADKVGTLEPPKINPTTVNLRKVNTTINTLNFTLIDINEVVTAFITDSTNILSNTFVKLWVGFKTDAGFAFGDYKLISTTKLRSMSRTENKYNFVAKEITDLTNKPMFDEFTTLNGAITDSDTSMTVDDASNFAASGKVKLDSEIISYTSKTATTLLGLSRGVESGTAAAHSDGVEIFAITELEVNPITMLLQIMISPGGGGTYDVLADGLGILNTDIDVATFESIRATNFPGDTFKHFLFDIDNGLKWIEENILVETNCRFIPVDGKISLALLDQILLSGSPDFIDENSSFNSGLTWKQSFDSIVNKVIIRWNYALGTDSFGRVSTFTDTQSVADHGEKKPLKIDFKGVTAALSGTSIVSDRGNRLIARLSAPQAEINVKTGLDKYEINIGDDVLFTNRFIPREGTGLLGVLSDSLEVIKKSVDLKTATITFGLQYTSYNNLRLGKIAPSSTIDTVNSQTSIDVPSGEGLCYLAGFKVRLWDTLTQSFESDSTNTISSVTTDTIVFTDTWVTTLLTTHKIKFADYADSSDVQRGLYAYIGEPSGADFADGTAPYQIAIST